MSDLEREKFEKWKKSAFTGGPLLERLHGKYEFVSTEHMWQGWLARSESAPSTTRESLHAEWMAQEKFLDWSNFLLHKLTGDAGSPAPAPTECPECGGAKIGDGLPCINPEHADQGDHWGGESPTCTWCQNSFHEAAPAPTEEK